MSLYSKIQQTCQKEQNKKNKLITFRKKLIDLNKI